MDNAYLRFQMLPTSVNFGPDIQAIRLSRLNGLACFLSKITRPVSCHILVEHQYVMPSFLSAMGHCRPVTRMARI